MKTLIHRCDSKYDVLIVVLDIAHRRPWRVSFDWAAVQMLTCGMHGIGVVLSVLRGKPQHLDA